jgi:tetratricopeptide (TPR) repeat protein
MLRPWIGPIVLSLVLVLCSLPHYGCGESGKEPAVKLMITAGPTTVSVTDSSATVQWSTNLDSDSHAYCWIEGSADTLSVGDDGLAADHLLTWTGLAPEITYSYYVLSEAPEGSVMSPERDFRTGAPPGCNPSEFISLGWTDFDNGDYDTATDRFRAAIECNAFSWPDHADSYAGMGWTHLMLEDIAECLQWLEVAIAEGYASSDMHAARAAAERDLPDFEEAIYSAGVVLDSHPDYVFSHKKSYDWRDLRIIRAQSFFALAEYESVNQEIELLGGTVQDPQDESFIDNLLAELERLEILYGE